MHRLIVLYFIRIVQYKCLRCRKICEHLAEVKQNIDMDGLKECVTQMWQKNFGNKLLESDTTS